MTDTRRTSALAAALATMAFVTPATAQMMVRFTSIYDPGQFAATAPVLGSLVPDLTLRDVDGRAWAMSELLGRTVVLIKGSYT